MYYMMRASAPSLHDISDYVTFCSANTRSSIHLKLKHTKTKTNLLGQFYINRIPRLWNSIPQIDISTRCQLQLSDANFILFSGTINFIENFNSANVCCYHPCQKCSRHRIRNCFNTTL